MFTYATAKAIQEETRRRLRRTFSNSKGEGTRSQGLRPPGLRLSAPVREPGIRL
jgi:hypothetical protein